MTVLPAPSRAAVAEAITATTERLVAELDGRVDVDEVLRVVLRCRADLVGSPRSALPELIERSARQRLLAGAAAPPG